MRLKFSKEFVALKQGCDEQTADELQSFLVQNARAGISAGAGAYQLQPVTSGSLLAAPQNQLQRASAQQQSQSHFQGYSLPPANNPYAEPVRDSRTQFDRTKAASPTAQFDSRNQSKSATMQFDQRSIQQAQYDQRSIPQYDTRNQQFTGNAYVQSSGPSQSGSVNQLSMQLQGANNAMINASANNQVSSPFSFFCFLLVFHCIIFLLLRRNSVQLFESFRSIGHKPMFRLANFHFSRIKVLPSQISLPNRFVCYSFTLKHYCRFFELRTLDAICKIVQSEFMRILVVSVLVVAENEAVKYISNCVTLVSSVSNSIRLLFGLVYGHSHFY